MISPRRSRTFRIPSESNIPSHFPPATKQVLRDIVRLMRQAHRDCAEYYRARREFDARRR